MVSTELAVTDLIAEDKAIAKLRDIAAPEPESSLFKSPFNPSKIGNDLYVTHGGPKWIDNHKLNRIINFSAFQVGGIFLGGAVMLAGEPMFGSILVGGGTVVGGITSAVTHFSFKNKAKRNTKIMNEISSKLMVWLNANYNIVVSDETLRSLALVTSNSFRYGEFKDVNDEKFTLELHIDRYFVRKGWDTDVEKEKVAAERRAIEQSSGIPTTLSLERSKDDSKIKAVQPYEGKKNPMSTGNKELVKQITSIAGKLSSARLSVEDSHIIQRVSADLKDSQQTFYEMASINKELADDSTLNDILCHLLEEVKGIERNKLAELSKSLEAKKMYVTSRSDSSTRPASAIEQLKV